MLRVISGKYRSRQLKEVKADSTRPTTDKNKEVLFNTIGQFFNGGKMVDLFSGSGALGIEAYSRGIDYCELVDSNFQAIKTIKENIENLKLDKDDVKVFKMDVFKFLESTNNTFDLIIADPPYNLNRYNDILDLISTRQLLNNGGIIVLESDNSTEFPEKYGSLQKYKEKILGYSKFTLYKREI
ncbi:MAG: 16S rRNA (guanine(966)-N(2))-methyltransferase RsmD [Candidatus Izemoplasmatales bacterium]